MLRRLVGRAAISFRRRCLRESFPSSLGVRADDERQVVLSRDPTGKLSSLSSKSLARLDASGFKRARARARARADSANKRTVAKRIRRFPDM